MIVIRHLAATCAALHTVGSLSAQTASISVSASTPLFVDVLLAPLAYTPTTIPLPAAVRPVTFQAQAVGIHASGLLTTDAFSIFAF